MRFVLQSVKGSRARLYTRTTGRSFWTDTKDLIFIKTAHNQRKAEKLKQNEQ